MFFIHTIFVFVHTNNDTKKGGNEMKTQDVKVLNEIYQGCEMGIDALDQIIPKIHDDTLKKELNEHQKDLKQLKAEIYEFSSNHNEEMESSSMWKEIMLKGSTKLNLLVDETKSHIAEMLIQGGNMGIISIRKLLNEAEELDMKVKRFAEKFIDLEEQNNEKMKAYL